MQILNKKKPLTRLSKEVKLSKDKEVITRIDTSGNIIYYNHALSEISGYSKKEILHTSYTILNHPDMPKSVFYFIWKTLLAGNSTYALIKNFTKNGDYYWQLTKFIVQKDCQNSMVSFLSYGKQADREAIENIEPLYRSLLEEEKKYSKDSAIKSLLLFLNSNNIATYNDYICRITYQKRHRLFSTLKI
jgi:PAS domain S-box-containing protein